MNVLVYFFGFVAVIGGILIVSRLPYAVFLLRRILQSSWPTTEATLCKAGVLSIVIRGGEYHSTVVWDSVFQVSFLANGKQTFGYFAFRSYEIEPAEAEQLQSSWNGAKALLRFDPAHPETFAFSRNFAGTYGFVYLPEFSGPSIAGSPDPLHLPKITDASDSRFIAQSGRANSASS